MKILSSLVVILSVLSVSGSAQQVTGAWSRISLHPSTHREIRETLFLNADGTYTHSDGGKWKVTGSVLQLATFGLATCTFKLQSDSQELALYVNNDSLVTWIFKRQAGAGQGGAASGLVGTWVGKELAGPAEFSYKLTMNADSTYSWEEVYATKNRIPKWKLSGDTLDSGDIDGGDRHLVKLQNNGQELVLQRLVQNMMDRRKWETDTVAEARTSYTRAKP